MGSSKVSSRPPHCTVGCFWAKLLCNLRRLSWPVRWWLLRRPRYDTGVLEDAISDLTGTNGNEPFCVDQYQECKV